MSFIRIKSIKGQKYAYRVENEWKKRKQGSRQKVKGYLGKVHPLEQKKEHAFAEFIAKDLQEYLKASSPKKIIADIVALELVKHGFSQKRSSWYLDDIRINMGTLEVLKGDAPIVLQLNNDFLCNHTLRKLVNFKSTSDQQTTGTEFAKAFVQAGIPVDQELFVHLFNTVYRRGVTRTW